MFHRVCSHQKEVANLSAIMDVDDFDQELLQQFSCMGTTDKEILVSQLQKLVGSANKAAAIFFLDMNNWNLQAAVCSYFDFEAPNHLPSMVLVKDATIGDGESVPPNTRFVKTWRVRNSGEERWPEDCSLRLTYGERLGSESDRVPVAALGPGMETDVSIEFTSPERIDTYYSNWRMCTGAGSYFGDTIWMVVQVDQGGTLALTQQLSHLSDLGTPIPQEAPRPNPFSPQMATSPTSQSLFQDSVQPQDPDNPNNMMC